MNIGIDIHSLTIGGNAIPFGYVLLFCFIGILFLIIWLLSKYLFIPFVRGKWDSIEKVGRLLPEVDKLIAQNEKLQLSYESLNHSVRTDLVHQVKDLSNSVTGIMAMVRQTQDDNRELAIEHAKLRTEHEVHVKNYDKSIGEIRLSVHQILKLMPINNGQKDS